MLKWVCLFIIIVPEVSMAFDLNFDAFHINENEEGGKTYSVTLQILVLMTLLSLLPAIILMMTSFTRVIIVLSILRQALGMPQTPSNQIIIGLSLFLSFFIMSPIFNKIYNEAVSPYLNKEINAENAILSATEPLKAFMYSQTRKEDLALFLNLSNRSSNIEDLSLAPLSVLIPAFVTSELKTAFQIGFIIFIPFLIIDLVVASVLMAMGMMMLSPLIISLPFKIMLFVLVDGWNLIMGTLAASFAMS